MPQADPSILEDEQRLERLRALCLLDSPVDPSFDRLTRLVCRVLDVPVSLVTLVAGDRQFFKSQIGLPEPFAARRETPLSHSFCQHAVATERPLIIEDAREHDLVYDNLAIHDFDVIAYAGIPLVTSDGYAIGTLCAIDSEPRQWTDDDIALLRDLAASVMTEIELQSELRERQRVEAMLRERQHFIDRIVNAAPTIIYILDFSQDRMTYLNRSLQSLLGVAVEAIDADFLIDNVHPDDLATTDERQQLLMSAGDDDVVTLVFRLKHADGNWHWIRGHHVVFSRDDDGQPVQILGAARDITTDYVAGQQEIDLQLERERTHLLRDFIQHTSHDLRTPLSLVQSSVDILRRITDRDKQLTRLQTIEDQVIRIRDVLDQFVTMTELRAIDSSNLEAIAMPVLFDELLSRYDAPIHTDYATDLPEVWGSRFQLSQAFHAVLENAVIYTPKDGQITVTVAPVDNRHVEVVVRDTGQGIQAMDLSRIFEPLYKGDRARTQGESKSGLGLALAKRVIDLHNGEIDITSTVNVGTTVRVLLPITRGVSLENGR